MPSKRKRTTDKCSWTEEQMKLAINAVKDGRYGLRTAARFFNVPLTSLHKRVKLGFFKAKMGTRTVFTAEQEEDICNHLLQLSKMFYGLTPVQLRRAVYTYAEKLSVHNKFNGEKREAGKDWMYGFMSRHPQLSFRKPEPTSINRIMGFNKIEINRFFDNLENLFQKHSFPPTRIFNVDETGISVVNRPKKIIGRKGQKQIGAATSGERGRNITVCCCMSASGSFTPPMFLYPRKRMMPVLEKNGPPGSIYKCTKSGWMTEDMFFIWIQHFANIHKPTNDDPILLILDNHSSHSSLAIYNFCRENGIIMLSIPPHTSHRIQPLDLTFFSSLKKAYDVECDNYLKSKPYEKIDISDVNSLFTQAYIRVANPSKGIRGFEKSGIFPINRNVFSEDDFYKSAKESEIFSEMTTNENSKNSKENEQVEINYDDPVPGCSKDMDSDINNVTFNSIIEVPKIKSNSGNPKRGHVRKQQSEILTSTPFKEELQKKEIKRKEKQDKLQTVKKTIKKNAKKPSRKPVIRRVFESSSEEEDFDEKDLCDDDSLDDVEPENIFKDDNDGISCIVCGEYGKTEMWFRCINCGGWAHKLCSGVDKPDNYTCDLCM